MQTPLKVSAQHQHRSQTKAFFFLRPSYTHNKSKKKKKEEATELVQSKPGWRKDAEHEQAWGGTP